MIRRFIYQSLTLACSVIAIGVAPAQADVVTSGSWQYDGSKIVKYLGNDITVTVPSSLDGQSITSIGGFIFEDCPNTLNIKLEEGINTLDDYSLIGINRIRSLTLPKSLKYVGNATRNTMTIENIYIYSLESWLDIDYTGMHSLANNSNLYIINGIEPQVTESLTEYTYSENSPLKKFAFSGIKNLQMIDLSGCENIPTGCFSYCTGLTKVRYSNDLKTIGEGAFKGTSVRNVILPESTTVIGAYAYSDCRYIRQIRLGRSITELGTDAFTGFQNDVVITSASPVPASGGVGAFSSKIKDAVDLFVPEESVDVYKSAWEFSNIEGCPANDTDWVVSNGYITAYTGTSTNVSIPQYVGVDFIQGFSSDVFQGNTTLESVIFPEAMESIPENAFKGCSSLSHIILSDNLATIANSAFEGCSSLVSISLPSEVQIIGEYAFANSGLLDFSIPESLAGIGKYAFEDCAIRQVDCRSLAQWMKIRFANPYANPCHNHARLFINGIELKTLQNYDIVINDYAFYGNESLEKVILKEAISVGKRAFEGCRNLGLIVFESDLIMIDRAAFDGSGTGETLAFGNNIWSIGEFAFRKGAGEDNLTSLYFGSELTYIEPWAFEGHEEIADIYISRNKPPFLCSTREPEVNYDSEVFSSKVKEIARLHVPDGCEAEYIEKWGFKNVIGNSTGILTVKIPDGGNLSFINPTKGMRLRISPEDDEWELSSASLREQDITSEIDTNGYYTLPIIEGDMTLSVVFKKKDGSSVITIPSDLNPIGITVYGCEVSVTGAVEGSEVRVYNTSGQLVTSTRNHTFRLNNHGVMILTVNGKTFKFAM